MPAIGINEVKMMGVGALFLYIAGDLLMRFGARRIGRMPHCSQCDYILGGLTTLRCPECGRSIDVHSVALGDRAALPLWTWIGKTLLLASLVVGPLCIAQLVRVVQWYELRATRFVIADLESQHSAERVSRAQAELDRRMTLGKLSAEEQSKLLETALRVKRRAGGAAIAGGQWFNQFLDMRIASMTESQRQAYFDQLLIDLRRPHLIMSNRYWMWSFIKQGFLTPERKTAIIEIALDEQARATSPESFPADWFMDYLGERAMANELTPNQFDQFITQMAPVSLRVRPTAIAGGLLPFEARFSGAGPRYWQATYRLGEVWIDGMQVDCGGLAGIGPVLNTWQSNFVWVENAGEQSIEVNVTFSVTGDHKVWHTREHKLKGKFTALNEAPPGYTKWFDDEQMKTRLKNMITARDAHGWSKEGVHMWLDHAEWPCDVAFEVIGRVDGKEYLITAAFGKKGDTRPWFLMLKPGKMDLILRSSENVARQSVDDLKPWRGEIVFEGIAVPAPPKKMPPGILKRR